MNFLGDLPTKLINPFKDFVLDDGYSRLNRIYLFAICIIAGVIININDYAGETIKCHGFTIFSEPFAENYCWVQGIYVILEAFDIPDENVPYPGIIPEETPCLNYMKSDGTMFMCPDDDAIAPLTRVKLMWYQWIPFYFFLCAAAFYIPYLIYHGTDIGKLKHIGKLLGDMFDDETEETAKLERASLWLSNKMASYIKAKGFFQNLFLRHKFFLIVLATKIVNLAVVVLVIMLTDQVNIYARSSNLFQRLEDEESDAVQSMKSDFISYLLSILRSVMEILSMIVLYAIATLKREEIRPAAITDSAAAAEDATTEIGAGDGAETTDTGGSATVSCSDKSTRRRYKKVMTVTSIVDTFNSHYSESNVHESSDADELLKLIESKSKSSFPSPTADLIKSVTEKKKTVRTDVDIQSMIYGN